MVTIEIREELYEAISRIAAATHTTVAELIDQWLSEQLAVVQEEMRRQDMNE